MCNRSKEERLKLKEATLKEIVEQYFELEAKPSRHWIDTRAILNGMFSRLWDKAGHQRQQAANTGTDWTMFARTAYLLNEKLFVALRPFFQWAVERGTPEHNPMLGIKPPPPLPARTRYLFAWLKSKALWLATEEEGWPFQQSTGCFF